MISNIKVNCGQHWGRFSAHELGKPKRNESALNSEVVNDSQDGSARAISVGEEVATPY